MPLYKSRFLPLFPDPAIPNNYCETDYCHQFIPGDHIRSQFYQTPCGQNEVCDPLFTDVTVGADLLGGDGMGGTIVCGNWTASGTWSCSVFYLTKTAGASSAIAYSGVGMTVGKYYRVTFSTNRTAGSFQVVLGVGGDATTSAPFEVTGNGYYVDLYFNDAADDVLSFLADADFDGTITDITVKELTYACWSPSEVWTFSDSGACKSDDTIGGTLTESVANYTTVDGYYQLSFTVSNYISGTLVAKVAGVTDQDTTVVSANGNYTLYFETGASGVISFEPSTDFVGCISSPDLRELRNDYVIQIVDDVNRFVYYTVEASYYHQYVTFDVLPDNITNEQDGEALPYGCYYIYLYDSCLTSGNNLIENPNFSSGLTDWSIAAYGMTYQVIAGQLNVTYDPFTGTDLITNGDFSGGAASWTLGAGWAVAGGATHTPGNTASLSQSITTNMDNAPGFSNILLVKFDVSGRTAGTVSVKFGGVTSSAFNVNGTIHMQMLTIPMPKIGAFTLEFIPSSDFDGTIDNIEVYEKYSQNNASGSFMLSAVASSMSAANYKVDCDLISVPDTDVQGVNPKIYAFGSGAYSSTVGTVSNTFNNYTPGTNTAQFNFSFSSRTFSDRVYPGTIVIDLTNMYQIEPYEATYISECFQYRESLQDSKLFVGYCDSPSLGFEFTQTGFRLVQRLVCRSFAPSYEVDRKTFNYGSGRSGVYYSEIQKWFGVYLDAVPETVHDAVALQLNCDHFLIGTSEEYNTEYVAKPDDYTPEWDRSGIHTLAPVRFDVKPKEGGQFFNRDC